MTFSIPWDSLIGGMLLGISATLMLLMNGKIAGISGILTGLLTPKSRDFAWRLLFVVGMISGGVIGVKLLGHAVPTDFGVSGTVLAAAGLLVGVGTRLAMAAPVDTGSAALVASLSDPSWRLVCLWWLLLSRFSFVFI